MSSLPKAVLLDRDGTINQDLGHVFRIEDFVLLPGVLDALKLLTENHIDIFIITNQSGIAKGYYTLKDYEKITAHMLSIFSSKGIAVKEVLFCPHHVEGVVPEFTQKCQCRKPETGMLKKIIDKQGYKPQDLVLIGDKNSDILAGKSLGLKTYLVETGYGMIEKKSTPADYVLKDLLTCVKHLLKKQ